MFTIKLNEDNRFFEMANIRPKYTGLPMVIWIQPSTGREKHGPQIKVEKHYGIKVSGDQFSVTIDSISPEIPKDDMNTGDIKSKDVELVKQFVIDNYDTLIRVWNDEIDLIEAIEKLNKV